jgi:beta-barrel assembly-enhancing protease
VKFVPRELKETADISRGKLGFKGWVTNAVVAVVTLGVLYLGIGVVTNIIVAILPDEIEARWFAGMIAKAEKENSPEFVRAQSVFRKLSASSELRALPYQIFIVEIPQPNAVAVPGGGVGVTRSLLREVKSEIGLATVLAHELGHQQHRHGLKRFGRALLWRAILSFALGAVDVSGVEVVLKITEAGYSREQEREADIFGLKLVHNVYGDTQGALEFFELVQREYEKGSARWMALLSTHPLTAERIVYLKQIQEQLRASR